MAELSVKKLDLKGIPGLSEKQLLEHHDVLYAGYVKKTNEIRQKLASADKPSANATYSELRSLKSEETFALNGVRLHEAYFDSIGGDGKPDGDALKMIDRDFGSYDSWAGEFKACGLASRGWVVLAYDLAEKRLRNFTCDAHNQGGIWGAVPVLVLDVYEHAYFIDYATKRKDYIETFMKNINWKAVNAAIAQSEAKP